MSRSMWWKVLLSLVLLLVSATLVYADDCGSLDDCSPTAQAAADVAVGVAVVVGVFLGAQVGKGP